MLDSKVQSAQVENERFKNTSFPESTEQRAHIDEGTATIKFGDRTEQVSFSRAPISENQEQISVTGESALGRLSALLGVAANSLTRRAAIIAAGAGLGAVALPNTTALLVLSYGPQSRAFGGLIPELMVANYRSDVLDV